MPASGLESCSFPVHGNRMVKKLFQRLLEVEIFHLTPTQWEWRVYEGDTPLKTGLAVSRHDAQADGDTALFRMIAANGSL
jgi:hypothetical protein